MTPEIPAHRPAELAMRNRTTINLDLRLDNLIEWARQNASS